MVLGRSLKTRCRYYGNAEVEPGGRALYIEYLQHLVAVVIDYLDGDLA
jgi:hypothetical protein